MRRCIVLQEDQLVRVLEKNTELTIQNTDLHKQVLQLQHVRDSIRYYTHISYIHLHFILDNFCLPRI